MSYRPFIEEAVKLSAHRPAKVIVWQRDQARWDPIRTDLGERDWQGLVESAWKRGLRADCVPVNSSDPIYVIHTSGTTGTPKGVVRDAGGHAVGLHLSISYLFNIHGPGYVSFTASDIGWVVGHSYILYGPRECLNILLICNFTELLVWASPVETQAAPSYCHGSG
jgi:propionyl-CoA synthetase